MSPTAAFAAEASSSSAPPSSCPDAIPVPVPRGEEQPCSLPAFKLVQIPGEDDPSKSCSFFDGFRWR